MASLRLGEPPAVGEAQRLAHRQVFPGRGRAEQVDIKPKLKPPETKRLKLSSDEPLLIFGFKFNLLRYIESFNSYFTLFYIGFVK